MTAGQIAAERDSKAMATRRWQNAGWAVTEQGDHRTGQWQLVGRQPSRAGQFWDAAAGRCSGQADHDRARADRNRA